MTDIKILKLYGEVFEDYDIKKLTTFKIGGIVKYLIYPKNYLSLNLLINYLKENSVEYKMFGKGSNLLCGDEYFEGAIIKLDRFFNNYYIDKDILIAESGCSIISLAYEMSKLGYSGLEFASGIPATLGGCLYMNAGAYKQDMSMVVDSVLIFNGDQFKWLSNEEIQYSYRYSIFHTKKDYIIIAAKIKLSKGEANEIKEKILDRRNRRISTQPLDKPSAGSVFKNCESKAAWQLIDELDLRGYKIGGAKISEKHSNFIINDGNAKSKDVVEIIDYVRNKVKDAYGFDLHVEVERFRC